jgi:hypothetical protein
VNTDISLAAPLEQFAVSRLIGKRFGRQKTTGHQATHQGQECLIHFVLFGLANDVQR